MIIDICVKEKEWGLEFGDLEGLVHEVVDAAFRKVSLDFASGTELGVVFGNDVLLHRLNLEYRGVDNSTNVLSFPQIPPGEGVPCRFLGDLVFARETIIREALSSGKKPVDHLAHLIVHGLLHLCGYDHVSFSEAETMEGIERDILEHFFSFSLLRPERNIGFS
ncbi:MAG: rRNA maturation RNase YbeY [Alphaproteobacteria bacterium]|nr:rRNA maturation RNase YbeY [Alphaproteobacteria bacterium]